MMRKRVVKTGIPVVQINTGGGCYIDGNMVQEPFSDLVVDGVDLPIKKNVS